MPRIDLAIYTEDPDEAAALQAYWRLADDGESWAQTVAAVREEHGLKQQEMTRIVQECGTAHLPETTCPQCGEAQWATSRSHLAEVTRQGNVVCNSCRAAAQAEREQAAKEEAARRRAEVAGRFRVLEGADLAPQDLSLFQAVALHTLFSDPAVEDAGLTTPTLGWPKDRPWAPSRLLYDLEDRLILSEPRTIKIHPASHPDAFVWEDGTLTGAVYLGKASFYLLGEADQLPERHPRLLKDLNRLFREGPWPEAWFGQWRDLWDELVLADAQAYLDMKLREHHLEMKQGEGTRTTLEDALASFSLGQVFNLIYRATKDSAAYYQRGGVNKQQAANSTVGRISAAADRARANGWEIKSFGRPWNLAMSAVGEVFFSKVMWQADVMTALGHDAQPPTHAVQAGASPDEVVSGPPAEGGPGRCEETKVEPQDAADVPTAAQESGSPEAGNDVGSARGQDEADADEAQDLDERRQKLLNDLRVGRQRRKSIDTPWPALSEVITFEYNAKVGVVAESKTREARIGRDIAVHAARSGVPTVLFTRYPPENLPPNLLIDENPYPTAEDITARASTPIKGELPRFLVVERFERMHTEPDPEPSGYDDYDRPEPTPWADRLVYAVRGVRLDYPSLWTTVLPRIDPQRPLRESAKSIDDPAMIMTDVCKQLLVVRRHSAEEVDVGFELDGYGPRTGHRVRVPWQELDLRAQ